MKLELLFPELEELICLGMPSRLAGPKAIAAHTFQGRCAEVTFHESRVWGDFPDMFGKQVLVVPQRLALPNYEMGCWVAYPFSVNTRLESSVCATWVEMAPKRRLVRHMRIYLNKTDAERDNAKIRAAFFARGLI